MPVIVEGFVLMFFCSLGDERSDSPIV